MDPPKVISSLPHVLMFPMAAQGHVNPMLKLAELLCLANIKVTFVNTACNHKRLTKNGDIETHFSQYPGFEFKVIPSGLPDDVPRTGPAWIPQMIRGLRQHAVPFLRGILKKETDHPNSQQVTCLIADSMLSYAFEVANELEVPVMEFKVYGASFLWVAVNVPNLLQAGEIPFKDDDMDRLVQHIPGMSNYLRRRDLPSMYQVREKSNFDLERLLTVIPTREKHPIILNTFEDLEGPILSLLKGHTPRIYSIGPLDANLKWRLNQAEIKESKHSGSLWEEDRSCISWLDKKPDKSVVYVGFGSFVLLTADQVREIWTGLVQSNKYFLWAMRPDMIIGTDSDSQGLYEEVLKGTEERGLVVSWAPQEEVLAHRAVGGFFTHSGWNSVLESITAGVPMLGWPYIGDQQVYSRNLEQVWKIGLDMKDKCDRSTVEKMVRDLMDHRKDELQRSIAKMSELAQKSITEEGSSYFNLNCLIEDIKLLSKTD